METILGILNHPLTEKIVILLAGVLGLVKYIKNRAIQKWAEVAFRSVEEFCRVDAEKGNKHLTDDKINMYCIKFREFMKRAGWWIVTDKDVEQAKGLASALNLIYTKGQEAVTAATELAKPEPVDPNSPNPL